ncbi:glycosyl hydrolase family 10 protein, partial [Striga asiatica]
TSQISSGSNDGSRASGHPSISDPPTSSAADPHPYDLDSGDSSPPQKSPSSETPPLQLSAFAAAAGDGIAPFPSLSPEVITSPPHFDFFAAVLRALFSRLTFCHTAWILASTVRLSESTRSGPPIPSRAGSRRFGKLSRAYSPRVRGGLRRAVGAQPHADSVLRQPYLRHPFAPLPYTDEPSGSRTGPDGILFGSWQWEKIESKVFDELLVRMSCDKDRAI